MTKSSFPSIVFTDGSCLGNPGVGGWGVVIQNKEGTIVELGGSVPDTTNNRMELRAAIEALKYLQNETGEITLHTDSKYVIQGITGYIFAWLKKQWRTSQGEEVRNKELWQFLLELVSKRAKTDKVNWVYVPGHAGVEGNDRCDKIALGFAKGRRPKLYSGSIMEYDINLAVPENLEELKAARPKSRSKAKGHYLSYVGQTLQRHETWPECEARVKGVSGAKFKKITSPTEEKETLSKWGVTPNSKD